MRNLFSYIKEKYKLWELELKINKLYRKVQKEYGKNTLETRRKFRKEIETYYWNNMYSLTFLSERYVSLRFRVDYENRMPYDIGVGISTGTIVFFVTSFSNLYVALGFGTAWVIYLYTILRNMTKASYKKEFLSKKKQIEKEEIRKFIKCIYDIDIEEI